jgi:hypothetical protein
MIALEDTTPLARANPLLRLAEGGIVAIPSSAQSADALWGEVPAYAKAIFHDRKATLIGFSKEEGQGGADEARWLLAAAFAGLALAGASRIPRDGGATYGIDPSLVAREVADALRLAIGRPRDSGAIPEAAETLSLRGAALARKVFEAHVEVPRATVERDEEAVRLGRKDARASNTPPRP